jgi:hypothetical protein
MDSHRAQDEKSRRGPGLDQEAGVAEVEGRLRREGRGQDDADGRDRGERLDDQFDRMVSDLLLTMLGEARIGARGGEFRPAGAAFAEGGGS